MKHDIQYMRRAIQLARNGIPHAAPNPTVGAVIVRNGKIIGEGFHRCCGQAHAEVNAIASVADKELLKSSTLYVTLEPCSHYGKTPPCADLIIRMGIPRVVVGCVDPFAKVHGQGIGKLRTAGIEVEVGVCEDECQQLIKRFATFHSRRRPYVILKWAESSDGYIGSNEAEKGHPILFSNTLTRMLVHKMRAECGAIMVGRRTAEMDDPSLTTRHWYGANPLRIVIDQELRLPNTLRLFDGTTATLVVTRRMETPHLPNVDFLYVNEEEDTINKTLRYLHEHNKQSLLVEGGAQLLQSFIDKGCWDEAHREIAVQALANGISAPTLKAGSRLVSTKSYGDSIVQTFCPPLSIPANIEIE